MLINITLTEQDLKKLVLNKLKEETNLDLTEKDILIEVKSKQNYKSEWESAAFRATINKDDTCCQRI